MAYYILNKNREVETVGSLLEMETWRSDNASETRIGINHLPDGTIVSTMFLKVPKEMNEEDLKLFETIVFEDRKSNGTEYSYKTYSEAIIGHLKCLMEVMEEKGLKF